MSSLPPIDPTAPPVPVPGAQGPPPTTDYGEGNKELPPDLQNALRTLAIELMDEDSAARREYVKRIKKMHLFWRGDQYIYWDEREGNWLTPSVQQHLKAKQPFRFVTNIVRPYGLTLMAALSQSLPKIKFWPQSPQQEDDVASADAASAIAEHVQRINRMDRLAIDEAFCLCLDGIVGGYVRWVNDADRFGTSTKPIIEPVEKEIVPAGYTCPSCGAAVDQPGPCPTCQYPVTEADLQPAQTSSSPTITGTEEIPNGQVVISMIGGMNLKVPMTANEMRDYAYLAWVTEVSDAKVIAMYPEIEEKIGKGTGLGSMNDTTERQDRLSLVSGRRASWLTSGAAAGEHRVTYHRIWLRAWAFTRIKDKALRAQISALFPTGCKVCFADDVYCESEDASMDDHWRVNPVTAGDGQGRDGILWDLLSIQERYNTLKNLQMETYQHGIPTLFMDRDVVNVKAWQNSGSRPGSGIGVRGRSGVPLANAFHETAPAQVSRQAIDEERNLMSDVAQFVTGAFPALFGGGALNNDTAAGYAMQRDQAMGRLGMVFRQQREFHAELITIAVEEMKRNMDKSAPLEIALLGPEGNLDTETIDLKNLRGQYKAYPEADENFPESFTQRKQGLTEFLTSGSPATQGIEQSPSAMRWIWRTMGIRDFQLPGEESRQKQYREIQALMRAAPTVAPGPPDPMTGAPTGQVPATSVPIDPDFDNNQIHFATVQEWIESAAGEKAAIENPAGFQNVRLHGLAHKAVLDQQAQQAALAAQPQGAAPPPQPPQ
jgi:hypothetical protein